MISGFRTNLVICFGLFLIVSNLAQTSVSEAQYLAPVPAKVANMPSLPLENRFGSSLSKAPPALPLASHSLSYDEQLGETLPQNWISMDYNVTAVAQVDSDGYGPAYLLNGLSNTGYWYQVGLSYDWPTIEGGVASGFQMVYEVFDPNGNSIFPSNGGGGMQGFVGLVNAGDIVLLNLYIGTGSLAGLVVMYVKDYNTGAYAYQTYSSEGASEFVGNPTSIANSNGFFTGLMTEEYHNTPYYGNEQFVAYSDEQASTPSGILWIDERILPGSSTLFDNSEQFTFNNYHQLHELSTNGATEYADAFVLDTGTDPVSIASFQGPSDIASDAGLAASGQFSITPSGGTPPYYYLIFLDNSLLNNYSSSAATFEMSINFGQLSVGSHQAYVDVLDSNGYPASSSTIFVNINPDPTFLISAQSAADQGQTVSINYYPSGGTLPYTETLYLNGQRMGQTSTIRLSQLGQNQLYAVLTDGAGFSLNSNIVLLTVNPDPNASLNVNSNVLDVGQSEELNGSVTQGTPPYTVAWFINGQEMRTLVGLSSATSFLLNASATGHYSVFFSVEDAVGLNVNSSTVAVNVNPDPTFLTDNTTTRSTNFFYTDTMATTEVQVTGGTAPFTYKWYLNGVEVSQTNDPNFTYHFPTMGTYELQVKVTDAVDYQITSKVITVDSGYDFVHIAIVIAIILVIITVSVFMLRRRRIGLSNQKTSFEEPIIKTQAQHSPPPQPTSSEDALIVLKRRFARGEINKEQYEEMLKELESDN